MGYQAPIEFQGADQELWVGEHRPDFVDLERIFRGLVTLDLAALEVGPAAQAEAWRAALPEDVHIIRILSPRAVHVHVPRAPLIKDLVLKLMPPRGDHGWRKLTARMERSRSHRAHLWAHRLRAIGIDTPRPLGYIERATRPSQFPSFAASEHILALTLTEVRDAPMSVLRVGGTALQEKRALIARVAAVLRAMHARRFFHADLHAGNMLILDREVMVIDLESMRRFAISHRAVLRTLVRLNRNFLDPGLLTRTDRMRFLRAYLRHEPDRSQRARQLWAKVLARMTVS